MLDRCTQARLVHNDLVEQSSGVDVVFCWVHLQREISETRLHTQREHGSLQWKLNVCPHRIDRHQANGGGSSPQGQRLALNAVQQVEDAPILQKGPVVQKPAQLLRQLSHGALRVFPGF